MITQQRKGNWFITASGLQFWPLDPQVADIRITDIAHALSNVCRFGGHCDPFYSVAQHSVHVSRLVPQELAMTALLHDATEAYIGDMVRPLKQNMPQFQEVEDRLWAVVAAAFSLPLELDAKIKHADNVALMTERRDIVIWTPHVWSTDETPDEELIRPLAPGEARELFLKRYLCLKHDRIKGYYTPIQEVIV